MVHGLNLWNELFFHFLLTFTLIILAWIIVRVISNNKLKSFMANKELETAKNSLDVIVEERTSELQEINLQLIKEINERKKYEKILKRAQKKAEEADNLKSIFLANMSHEIRTPLNGILGFNELLRNQDITSEKKSKYLDIINLNGQQLLKIIDDILDISIIESNQLKINRVKFKLRHIFPDTIEFFNRQKKIRNKENIEIIYYPYRTEADDYIFSDPTRIQQVLYNLIDNGLKFSEKGYIKFGERIDNGYVFVFVEDTGIGVDFDHRKSIFTRFRQGDESLNREFQGIGLGLSISKGIVEILGGMIWHDCTYKKGSRFCFSLPIHFSEKNEYPLNFRKYFEPLQKKRIILVENEYHEFNFLAESFKEYRIINYRTEFSKISPEINDFKPDLIIIDLDHMTPEIGSIISRIKIYTQKIFLYVILPETHNKISEFNNTQCDKVFLKPLNIQHLLEDCLADLVENH